MPDDLPTTSAQGPNLILSILNIQSISFAAGLIEVCMPLLQQDLFAELDQKSGRTADPCKHRPTSVVRPPGRCTVLVGVDKEFIHAGLKIPVHP